MKHLLSFLLRPPTGQPLPALPESLAALLQRCGNQTEADAPAAAPPPPCECVCPPVSSSLLSGGSAGDSVAPDSAASATSAASAVGEAASSDEAADAGEGSRSKGMPRRLATWIENKVQLRDGGLRCVKKALLCFISPNGWHWQAACERSVKGERVKGA